VGLSPSFAYPGVGWFELVESPEHPPNERAELHRALKGRMLFRLKAVGDACRELGSSPFGEAARLDPRGQASVRNHPSLPPVARPARETSKPSLLASVQVAPPQGATDGVAREL
jgi:hypothetical protein